MRTTCLTIFVIVSAALAAPLPRTLPLTVDATTAKIHLSQRKYLINY